VLGSGAQVGVNNAAVALVEMSKLRPRLGDEAIEAVWEGFIQIATDRWRPNENLQRGARSGVTKEPGLPIISLLE
jgi:hypothetical protein